MTNGETAVPPGIVAAGTFVATDQAFALAIVSRLNPAAIRDNTICRFIFGVTALLGAFEWLFEFPGTSIESQVF